MGKIFGSGFFLFAVIADFVCVF